MPWKGSYRNRSSEILKHPPQPEALLHFSSSPRGILVREQGVVFQQEMLILDLSVMHVCHLFPINT